MKKAYSKPEIAFEDFTMSTSIAVGCEIKIEGQNSGNCGYKYDGGNGSTMFTVQAGTAVCNLPMDDDETNGFCYHIPVEGNNMFNS